MESITNEINALKSAISANKRILIITSCSKDKINAMGMKAIDLYQGQFLSGVKKLASKLGFRMNILSSKYDLLDQDDLIDYYDLYIKNLSAQEKRALSTRVIEKIKKIKDSYDVFVILAGKEYQKLLCNEIASKSIIFQDNRGSGGFLQMITYLNKVF